MNYYIFRHGETYQSQNKIHYGKDIETAEILPEKSDVTKRLSQYLLDIPTDANFSSPYLRCKQTVEIVSNITNKKFSFEERIGEYRDHEDMEKFAQRIGEFVDEIKKKNFQSVTICSHGWPIAALRHTIVKGSFTRKDLDDFPLPGQLTIIKGNNVEILDFN